MNDFNEDLNNINNNQFDNIDGIGNNIFNSNETNENVQGGYDSFRSLELEELEKEFDRLFGTFTESDVEAAQTVAPNIEEIVKPSNLNENNDTKSNVFGNFKTGVDLGNEPSTVFGAYGVDSAKSTSNIYTELNTNSNEYTNTGMNVGSNPYSYTEMETNKTINNTHQQITGDSTNGSVFHTFGQINQQESQSQKQQAVTLVKKVGFWAKIKAFFTGNSTTTTTKNQVASAKVGYNQNLNDINSNGQATNNSTGATSKGFWNIFKGNK